MSADTHREAFREEAYELLTELESSLLELEERPTDEEVIGRVFRAMHTIKGSGAMFGFDDISHFTHEVETVFDLVRKGKLSVTKELVNLTLSARDRIRAMLDADGLDGPDGVVANEQVVAGLKKLASGGAAPAVAAKAAAPTPWIVPVGLSATFRIRFRPPKDMLLCGGNPAILLAELRGLGSARVIAMTSEIPSLDAIVPEECFIAWDVIVTTDKGIDAIRDVFMFVEDGSDLQITVIEREDETDEDAVPKRLGEILVERGDVDPNAIVAVLGKQRRIGDLLIEAGVTDNARVQSAVAEQQILKEVHEKRQSTEAASSIRVPAEKLDYLVNLVGELVTVQARLSQAAAQRHADVEIGAIAEEVERLTWELRDQAMNVRMMPIGTMFSKFKRLVRDLSNELSKNIEMTTEGAETELDKTVLERINDPLVHLIRNSIDHGIELPADRIAAGKSAHGTVHLSAVHSGANVLISIKDDGKGLDKDAIRQKGIERGLITAGVDLSDKELYGLILLPGFSTAKKVTSVSGRGVGMDVVKRAIDSLRGSIEIKSELGVGSTITIKLPLTLAIIDGLLVKISTDFFVLPLSAIEECIELTREESEKADGRALTVVRDELVPYVRLRDRFFVTGDRPDIEQIVIVAVDGNRIGLVVDKVIGEHQTVIKSLGRVYRDTEGLSGATILGDGTVALILDVNRLVHDVEAAVLAGERL